MIRWALRGAIDKFERDGDSDASVGLIGVALGGLALARSRRTA